MTARKKIGCYCIEVCKRDDPANNGLRCIGLPAELLPGEKSNPAHHPDGTLREDCPLDPDGKPEGAEVMGRRAGCDLGLRAGVGSSNLPSRHQSERTNE